MGTNPGTLTAPAVPSSSPSLKQEEALLRGAAPSPGPDPTVSLTEGVRGRPLLADLLQDQIPQRGQHRPNPRPELGAHHAEK